MFLRRLRRRIHKLKGRVQYFRVAIIIYSKPMDQMDTSPWHDKNSKYEGPVHEYWKNVSPTPFRLVSLFGEILLTYLQDLFSQDDFWKTRTGGKVRLGTHLPPLGTLWVVQYQNPRHGHFPFLRPGPSPSSTLNYVGGAFGTGCDTPSTLRFNWKSRLDSTLFSRRQNMSPTVLDIPSVGHSLHRNPL